MLSLRGTGPVSLVHGQADAGKSVSSTAEQLVQEASVEDAKETAGDELALMNGSHDAKPRKRSFEERKPRRKSSSRLMPIQDGEVATRTSATDLWQNMQKAAEQERQRKFDEDKERLEREERENSLLTSMGTVFQRAVSDLSSQIVTAQPGRTAAAIGDATNSSSAGLSDTRVMTNDDSEYDSTAAFSSTELSNNLTPSPNLYDYRVSPLSHSTQPNRGICSFCLKLGHTLSGTKTVLV